MKTLIEHARTGIITPQVRLVAEKEGVNSATLCRQIADGSTVIMQRGDRLVGIGRGLSNQDQRQSRYFYREDKCRR